MSPGLYHEASGQGETVVLLHGFGLDRRMWMDQIGPLAKRFRVINVDLRGFGKSPAVDGPFSHLDDVRRLVGEESVRLVGFSMGGRIAVDFAYAYPRSVAKLVLVDADVSGWPLKRFGPTMAPLFEAGRRGDVALAKRLWLEHDLFAPARRHPRVAHELRRMIEEYSGWHFANAGHNLERKPERSAADILDRIAAPTLAMVGELDLPDFQDIADAVASRVPGAEKFVVPGAGHMSNMENPGASNRALLEFL